jgi:hypothetical protein
MKLFKKNPQPAQITRTEALRCIPHRAATASWRILDNGDTLIEYPLNIRPFFLALANRFHQGGTRPAPTRKLQLDRLGSMVWQMADGGKEVGTIVREFARASGLTLQEAEISVTAFFRQLGRRGLIVMR